MTTTIEQKRTFLAQAGMSIDTVKNAKNASLLQKKYIKVFDIDNNQVLSQKKADLFNATIFSEKADGTLIFWTRKKDGTKQEKSFNSNTNFKYDVDFEVATKNNNENTPQQGILEKAKQFFENLVKYITEPTLSTDTDTAWTKNYNWSEGCNRKISTIVINSKIANDKNFIAELSKIAEKVGCKIKICQYENDNAIWIEDYSIRRADGKIYILPSMPKIKHDVLYAQNTKRNSMLSDVYSELLDSKNIVRGKSYLEGGNVLNTRLKNGQSAVIIGEKSIEYSLKAMNLEKTPENIEIVKKQIAKDLGIDEKNITYIYQFDFHIDMFYRPLQDGVIATPDYEEAIKILENTDIKKMDDKTKKDYLDKLKEMKKLLSGIINGIDKDLQNAGYKIQKIPCFNIPSSFVKSPLKLSTGGTIKITNEKLCQFNYLNGVSGTSNDNRQFIILNKSDYKEIDDKIAQYYKAAGLSDVYFVPTQNYLVMQGGIDCLTQEK